MRYSGPRNSSNEYTFEPNIDTKIGPLDSLWVYDGIIKRLLLGYSHSVLSIA